MLTERLVDVSNDVSCLRVHNVLIVPVPNPIDNAGELVPTGTLAVERIAFFALNIELALSRSASPAEKMALYAYPPRKMLKEYC